MSTPENNSYIYCEKHMAQHWGRWGAAGILLYRYNQLGEVEILLGKTRKHGYWANIGGALNQGETPAAAALREFEEELGINIRDMATLESAVIVTQCPSWRYTTYVARLDQELDITKLKLDLNEIVEVRWVTRRGISSFNVLREFQKTVDILGWLLPPNLDPVTGAVVDYDLPPEPSAA
ncbi:hypothetical protein GGS26DRAFT_537691 [Hypomontagnella submonticulosa]|nr:hypothetical protein GGS26DRAFT_537691 [Hypomontagnella submonticulosa]